MTGPLSGSHVDLELIGDIFGSCQCRRGDGREQAKEEHVHAMKFFDFINERRGRVALDTIKQPPKEWKSALNAFEEAFKHEQYISDKIDKLVDLAVSIKDHDSAQMLQWFVEEQVEEEATADGIVQQLKLTKEKPNALMMLDKALGYRGKK